MNTTGKRGKHIAWRTRKILADNVRRLMDRRYETSQNKPLDLAEDAGVARNTIQRILNKEGISIDSLDQVAKGLRVEPYELLKPGDE